VTKKPAKGKPRLQVFVVSSGGAIADWSVSSASNAETPSTTFFGRSTFKVHPTVVSTKERGEEAIFMQALNRRLAGYAVVEDEQEPTAAQQETAASEVSSGS
jgi:hypothetical protein